MISAAFIDVLPSAVGIAISPVPIAVVLLVLMGKKHPIGKGLAFIVGWVTALLVVMSAISLLIDFELLASSNKSDIISAIITFVLGGMLVFLAIKNWMTRPKGGKRAKRPKWMATLEHLKIFEIFGIGFALGGANPKNLLLSASAATLLAEAQLPTNQIVSLIVLFVCVASITVIAPLLYYLLSGKSGASRLAHLKAWLIQHNNVIMAIVLFIIGSKLVIESLITLVKT